MIRFSSGRNGKMERRPFPFFQIGLIFLLVSSVFLLPSLGQAAQVSLAWNPDTDSNIAGYKIYSGTSSSSYSQWVNVGLMNTYTVTNLTVGQTYYFAATAIGTNGSESGFSNQVSYTVPSPPAIYTITASAGTGGSISPSGAVLVNSGNSQSFTITPDTGYLINSVLVDEVSVGAVNAYAFTNVTASHTITASFTQNQSTYTITASAGTNGTISPSGSITVNKGSSKTFTIKPKWYYRIDSVMVDGVSVGAVRSYTFTNVTAPHTITATFKR